MVFWGFSVVMFLLSFGLMFYLVPQVLGQIYTVMGEANMPIPNESWQQTYNDTEAVLQYIIPLMPAMGLAFFVIKGLMAASVIGRD